jgi:hypothetical protein
MNGENVIAGTSARCGGSPVPTITPVKLIGVIAGPVRKAMTACREMHRLGTVRQVRLSLTPKGRRARLVPSIRPRRMLLS